AAHAAAVCCEKVADDLVLPGRAGARHAGAEDVLAARLFTSRRDVVGDFGSRTGRRGHGMIHLQCGSRRAGAQSIASGRGDTPWPRAGRPVRAASVMGAIGTTIQTVLQLRIAGAYVRLSSRTRVPQSGWKAGR